MANYDSYLYDDDDDSKVYLITPDESAGLVCHQYGCLACLQLSTKAKVDELEGDAARLAEDAIGCRDNWNALPLNDATHKLGELLGSKPVEAYEGLLTLTDGRMVAVYNCD